MTRTAAAITAAFAWSAVMAQEAPVTVQQVVVTGSNIKRADSEGPAPVSVMSAKDIKDTGAQTVADLIKFIPSMGSNNLQDFTSGSGFAKGVATASLRGLGSDSTLVLLNGRRVTPSPYADPNNSNSVLYNLNSIPVSAIERIEILQDGASAIYGSDAIAGVMNFILKQNYQGAEVQARGGANDDGNFRKKGFSGTFGHGDLDTNGYSVMATVDFNQRDRTARRDENDIEYRQLQIMNGRFASNYSSTISQYPIYLRETRPGSKSFGVTQATAPTNMRFNLGCPAAEQITGSTADGFLPTSVYIGRTFCNYNADQFLEAQGAAKDVNFLSHGELKLGRGMTAFGDIGYSRAQREFTGAPITIGSGSTTNFTSSGVGTPFQAILPIGHPDNPFTDTRSSINYRFTSLRGGSQTVEKGIRGLVGVRGSAFNWDWETAYLWNQAKEEDTTYGRLFLPTLRKLVTDNRSLASLNADPTLGHDVVTYNASKISQWDAKATTEFGQLAGGKIGAAVGVELRRESVSLNPDPLVASGQIFGLANTILQSSRDVKSAFFELRTPVLKNLEFDFAGRADKYPSIKTNFVPKVGGKWTINDKFAIRGTYAEGFRAPSLSQIVPGGAQYFLSGVWDPKRCAPDHTTPLPGGATNTDCAASVAGTGGFNPDLKPETSRSWNLGFIFSPTSWADFTVDAYRLKKMQTIILGTSSDALKNEDKSPQNVTRNQDPASFLVDASGKPIPGTGPLLMVATPWTNQGMTIVGGVDIEGRFRKNLGTMGSLTSVIRTSYVSEYKVQQNPGDVMHNTVGTYPYYSDWALTSGTPTPRWKTNASVTWKYADHALTGSVNYLGPLSLLRRYDGDTTYAQPFCAFGTRKSTDAAPDRDTSNPLYENFYPQCSVKEYVTFGANYTYTGFKNWTLNVNIQNIFDTKAPYDPLYSATGYGPNGNPYGRYFQFTANYRFK